jgi:hypothetical protein
MDANVDKEKRQEAINKVANDFRFLIKENNKIVKDEITRLNKKYGKGQGDFVKNYLIPEHPIHDDIRYLTRQLFHNKERRDKGEFYTQMYKYFAMINKLKEMGYDYTVPYCIFIPTHEDFCEAFNSGLRKAGRFLDVANRYY